MITFKNYRNFLSLVLKAGALDNAGDKSSTPSDVAKNKLDGALTREEFEIQEKLNELKKLLDAKQAEKNITEKSAKSLETNLKGTENDPDSEPTRKLLELYKRRAAEATGKSEELKKLIAEIDSTIREVNPETNEKESKVDKEKLSNMRENDFLKEIPKGERLQHITKGNIETEKVANGEVKELTFEFPNEELMLRITAGQVLPKEVGTVTIGNTVYTRKNIAGEFFSETNERLIIVDDTHIEIGDLRTAEDFEKLSKENEEKVSAYLKENPEANEALIRESASRGIDLKFADLAFGEQLKGLAGNELENRIEATLTDFDRIRGYNNISADLKDGKYNPTLSLSVLFKYSRDTWKDKATKYGITEKEVKDFESEGEQNMYLKGSEIQNADSLEGGDWLKGDRLLENPEFDKKLTEIARSLGANKDELIKVMKAESRLDPRAVNPSSNATGLIQFMPSTARGLGTTVGKLRQMTAIEQLDYVEKYFRPYRGRLNSIEDLYKVVFYPLALGKSQSFVFGSERGASYAELVGRQNACIARFGNGRTIDGYTFARYVNNHVSKFSA